VVVNITAEDAIVVDVVLVTDSVGDVVMEYVAEAVFVVVGTELVKKLVDVGAVTDIVSLDWTVALSSASVVGAVDVVSLVVDD